MFSFTIYVAFKCWKMPQSISVITCQHPVKESQVIFSKFPSDADDAGQETTLREASIGKCFSH